MSDAGSIVIPARAVAEGVVVVRRAEAEVLERTGRRLADLERAAEGLAARCQAAEAEAQERGLQAGLAEGRARWAGRLAQLADEAQRLRAEAASRLVPLAVGIARSLLGDLVARDPGVVVALATRALQTVAFSPRAVIRVHPDDVAALRAAQPRLAEVLEPGAELTLVADPGAPRGSCLVQTDAGEVDGSVEVHLKALEAELVAGDDPAGGRRG